MIASKITNGLNYIVRPYLDNPFGRRDFLSQFRNKRAMTAWSVYVFLLCLVYVVSYKNTLGAKSLASIQSATSNFFAIGVMLMSMLIAVIAPNLTAYSVTMERQRQSLDLIASAPVPIRHFLVGKLLSSYRTVWFLLILALPPVAVNVIVGGATWGQVMAIFLLLSGHGLIYTSIGLRSSVRSGTSAPRALISSLITVFGFWFVSVAGLSSIIMSFAARSSFGASTGLVMLMSPTGPVLLASGTGLMPGSNPISLWLALPAFLGCVLISHLILGSASTYLNWSSSNTQFMPRVAILGAIALAGWIFQGYAMNYLLPGWSFSGTPSRVSTGALQTDLNNYAALGFLPVSLMCINLISASLYTPFGLRRQRNDGRFKIKECFSGRPSGALPFAILCLIVWVTPFAYTIYQVPPTQTTKAFEGVFAIAIRSLGFIVLAWSISRLASSLAPNIQSSWGISLAAYLGLFFVLFAVSVSNWTDSHAIYGIAMFILPIISLSMMFVQEGKDHDVYSK